MTGDRCRRRNGGVRRHFIQVPHTANAVHFWISRWLRGFARANVSGAASTDASVRMREHRRQLSNRPVEDAREIRLQHCCEYTIFHRHCSPWMKYRCLAPTEWASDACCSRFVRKLNSRIGRISARSEMAGRRRRRTEYHHMVTIIYEFAAIRILGARLGEKLAGESVGREQPK